MTAASEPPVVHGDERTPPTEGADTRDAQVAAQRLALVSLIQAPYPGSWSTPTEQHAEAIAAAILHVGFVRERGFWGCGCPSCLASIGDCRRCGQRDQVPGLGLCEPCNTALEAEVS